MPLTDQMSLPEVPKEATKKWTSRVVFSFNKLAETITKAFDAIEIMLFFGILISGFGELMGRNLSLGWYGIVVILILENIYSKFLKKDEVES